MQTPYPAGAARRIPPGCDESLRGVGRFGRAFACPCRCTRWPSAALAAGASRTSGRTTVRPTVPRLRGESWFLLCFPQTVLYYGVDFVSMDLGTSGTNRREKATTVAVLVPDVCQRSCSARHHDTVAEANLCVRVFAAISSIPIIHALWVT